MSSIVAIVMKYFHGGLRVTKGNITMYGLLNGSYLQDCGTVFSSANGISSGRLMVAPILHIVEGVIPYIRQQGLVRPHVITTPL
jgi:hypothetical protein